MNSQNAALRYSRSSLARSGAGMLGFSLLTLLALPASGFTQSNETWASFGEEIDFLSDRFVAASNNQPATRSSAAIGSSATTSSAGRLLQELGVEPQALNSMNGVTQLDQLPTFQQQFNNRSGCCPHVIESQFLHHHTWGLFLLCATCTSHSCCEDDAMVHTVQF